MESYYKRFHAIRKLFFPYKTTQEVVEYYYFWKVTTDVEPQRDLDEVSSQSEEYDELSLQTSSSQIAKRKRDTMHDSFNGDPLLGGWGAYDNTSLNRSAEFTPCHEEGPPLKRSRSEDFKMSTDSFFSREVDGLGHSQVSFALKEAKPNSFTSFQTIKATTQHQAMIFFPTPLSWVLGRTFLLFQLILLCLPFLKLTISWIQLSVA